MAELLSVRARESIKTALAMTCAYGLGLQLGWDRPYWAGFAIAFVSLSTVGQSLDKAALRMLGTLLAVVVALSLIGLFSQHRWWFIFSLSVWLAVCAYNMVGNPRQYFWFVAGFVVAIITMDGGPDPANAFAIAMLRAQQTGLGILVYGLISVLLWPNDSSGDFKRAAVTLCATQKKLLDGLITLCRGETDRRALQGLCSQQAAQFASLQQLLDSAATDSSQVREELQNWRYYARQQLRLMEALQRLGDYLPDLEGAGLNTSWLDEFAAQVPRRFELLTLLLESDVQATGGDEIPQLLPVGPDVASLSHLQHAAVEVVVEQLREIEIASREMLLCLEAIRTSSPPVAGGSLPRLDLNWSLNLEALAAAGRVALAMWVGFLLLVYVPDLPGGAGLLSTAGPIALILFTSPQMPVSVLFRPFAEGILVAAFLYLFVMPQLSSFTGLGVMIFVTTFLYCFHYSQPQQGFSRAFGLAMFVTIISVSNEQSYNFLSVTTTIMMFLVLFPILLLVANFPFRLRPRLVCLRLLRRYLRSVQWLLMAGSTGSESRLTRWRRSFHLRQIVSLPAALSLWTGLVPPAVLGTTPVAELQALVADLQALSLRLRDLLARDRETDSQAVPWETRNGLLEWRSRAAATCARLAADPGSGTQGAAVRESLQETLIRMEEQLNAEQQLLSVAGSTAGDKERDAGLVYQQLGALRGFSETLVDFAERAARVNWALWREERFAA
jgi:uncharacterized membrane protein YccC